MNMNINPNINPKTGIRYGIIAANEIDSDFLSDFTYVYQDIFCSNCGEKLSDIYCPECGTENIEYQEQEPISFEYMGVGIIASWDTNSNYVTVFKSRSIFKRALCSPCYPNAGDLSTTGNYKTYGIPTEYLNNR